jgi:hypothetical protein
MKKFGKPKEVNTKVREKNHKYFAKSIGCQSQKQHSTFMRQIAQ